ncbi:MAG: helix-turn-helix transcriptional regulator [Clostridia bacterium]|nr:helix-turn-helix transcriptional regulator [Clostridia bacterium]
MKKEVNNLFAERLSELIEENNKTKREVGRETHISAQSISDWSTGKIQPTAENIYVLAQYFNCTSDYLLGLTNEDEEKTNPKYHKCNIVAHGHNNF